MMQLQQVPVKKEVLYSVVAGNKAVSCLQRHGQQSEEWKMQSSQYVRRSRAGGKFRVHDAG